MIFHLSIRSFGWRFETLAHGGVSLPSMPCDLGWPLGGNGSGVRFGVGEFTVIIRFKETFALPIDEVFSYFATPADWTRLYGLAGEVEDRGDGWHAIPLESFPFPLVAKNTFVEPARRVEWTFRGFWRGGGEVTFSETDSRVTIQGYEDIAVRWLLFLSPVVEKLFLERRFRGIWELGWRRLRRAEGTGPR